MLVHLCQAQIDLGLDVEVISIGTYGNYQKPLEKKLTASSIPCKTWRMMALPDLRESLKILKYCKATFTDVIHSHGYKGNILLGLIPKKQRQIPLLTSLHGYTRFKGLSKITINQWLDRLCLKRLDLVVLVSESMRDQIHGKVPDDKVMVVENGIPEEPERTLQIKNNIWSEEDYRICSLGRLSCEKNFQLLINAMPEIIREIPQAKLIVYGEGPQRIALEQLIHQLNLQDKVLLPGYIENPSLIYPEIDIFVNCSLTEGMPITLLEAMREGCQIIATSIPANKQLLKGLSQPDCLVGFDPPDLVASVKHIYLKDHEQKSNERIFTKEYFKKNFTSSKMANQYFSIYRTLSNAAK